MDYEKKYKEALERARALRNEAIEKEYAADYIKDYETIFPELRESEDERIRKELIEQVGYLIPDKEEYDDDGRVLPTYHKRIGRYRAWLEKQKEQKPAEWSEEDRRTIDRACIALRAYANGELPDILPSELLGYADRLQSLRPQPKPEWSEEDLQHKSWILECLADGEKKMPKYAEDFQAAYKWLKSIRPQTHWKPSKEQMMKGAVEGYVCATYPAAQGNVIEYSVKYPEDKSPYKFGDKVRIIVLPKED